MTRGTILRHEWRTLRSDRSLWAIAALMTVLIGYAAWNGAAHVRFQNQTLAAIHDDEQKRFSGLRNDLDDYAAGRKEAKGFLDPRGAASLGNVTGTPYLRLPPSPMAALAVGQSDLYPYYIRAGMRSREMNAGSEELENPVNLLTGHFDLAFVIVFLFPLTILALSYNLISAEKEQGTLALTLSQPVSLRRIVAGKVALRISLLIGFTAILSAIAVAATGGTATGWALWLLTVTAYGAFWFGVAAAVNSLGLPSATNAVATAGIWLVFVLLIPALVNAAASSFYPVPSRVEMIQSMRTATKQATAKSAALLSRYMEDHPELVAATTGGKAPDPTSTTYAIQQEVDRLLEPVIRQYDEQSARQQAVVDRFRFLSPAILTQGALIDISGTSAERQKNFIRQVDEFLADWRAYFYPRVFSRAKLTSADLDRAPQFQYREEPERSLRFRVAVVVFVLLWCVAAVGLFTLVRLNRYPITA